LKSRASLSVRPKRSEKEIEMTSLTLAVVMQTALLATPAQEPDMSYAKAHAATLKTGRPMVILVGAKWCPACVQMKNNIVPQLLKRGSLRNVAFAQVDIDKEKALGRELTKGGPIPQLVMFRHTKAGWRLRKVIGGQSVQKVERFIAEGVALNEADKKKEPAQPKSDKAESKKVASRPAGDKASDATHG
jgi:thioredoxin-like negative regulator of GroEL